MLDYISLLLKGITPQDLLENDLLTFKTDFVQRTGELPSPYHKAIYWGLVFKVYEESETCYVSGSLHKYKNKGDHNYDRFTITDLFLVVKDLEDKFGIKAKSTVVRSFEAGVNCHTNATADLIVNSLLMYKFKEFVRYDPNDGNIRRSGITQMKVKAYNKSKQYSLKGEEIFRFELKFIKMQYLQNKGIEVRTLNDFLNPMILNQLGQQILKVWDDVILKELPSSVDVVRRNRLAHRFRRYDFQFWNDLKERVKSGELGKNTMRNELRKLRSSQDQANFGLAYDIMMSIRDELAIIERPHSRHME